MLQTTALLGEKVYRRIGGTAKVVWCAGWQGGACGEVWGAGWDGGRGLGRRRRFDERFEDPVMEVDDRA
nr:hypothetical protein CFP56_41236 [Quercus suber]